MSEPIISKELNELTETVDTILSNEPTVYEEAVTITEDNAYFNNCTFNDTVTVTGQYVKLSNCTFNNSLIVGIDSTDGTREGAYSQVRGCVFNGSRSDTHSVVIYTSAYDVSFNDFHISSSTNSGIYYASYGGNFQNFTIKTCRRYGIAIHAGGVQIQNGKIFMCGHKTSFGKWSGGIFIGKKSGLYEYIPEVHISGVSIQQNYGFGLYMQNVKNSYVNAVVMGNNCGICAEDSMNENGVYQELTHTNRVYGCVLNNCDNVTGSINGVSCHTYWKAADLGYSDNIPSNNNIDVTWCPVYYDNDSNWATSFKAFAKFLPEVHAETINGIKINSQYTEANFTNTDPLTNANTYVVGSDGLPDYDDTHCKIIKLQTSDGAIVSNKGLFRVYVEAPGFNIYTFVKVVGADGSIWEQISQGTSDLHRYYASGQYSYHSSVVPYDASSVVADGVALKRVELRLVFNSIETLDDSVSVTPKVRVQHFSY